MPQPPSSSQPLSSSPSSLALAFTDRQLAIVEAAAAPLDPCDRSGYLQTIGALLAGQPLDDAAVTRAAQAAARHFRDPVALRRANGHVAGRIARGLT